MQYAVPIRQNCLLHAGGEISQAQLKALQAVRVEKLAVNLKAMLQRYTAGDIEGFKVQILDNVCSGMHSMSVYMSRANRHGGTCAAVEGTCLPALWSTAARAHCSLGASACSSP
jgi:hypothetical protein